MKAQSVILIAGSSSGIGFETAVLLARNRFNTYASMHNLEKSTYITEIEIANRGKLPGPKITIFSIYSAGREEL